MSETIWILTEEGRNQKGRLGIVLDPKTMTQEKATRLIENNSRMKRFFRKVPVTPEPSFLPLSENSVKAKKRSKKIEPSEEGENVSGKEKSA